MLQYARSLNPNLQYSVYTGVPRWDFFQANGVQLTVADNSGNITVETAPWIREMWEREADMSIQALQPHVDFWVIDAYARWAGAEGVSGSAVAPWIQNNLHEISNYWYARYPGHVPTAGYGLFVGDRATQGPLWRTWWGKYIDKCVARLTAHGGGKPLQAWISTCFNDNGYQLNNATAPSPWTAPTWQLLIAEADFRAMLDHLITHGVPNAVLFEGWSDEKQRIFARAQSIPPLPSTTPTTPWTGGAAGGNLMWDPTNSDPLARSVHPYLQNVINDYKP